MIDFRKSDKEFFLKVFIAFLIVIKMQAVEVEDLFCILVITHAHTTTIIPLHILPLNFP